MRAEGEAEAATIISRALNKAGEGLVQFRRIEASKDIAHTLSQVRRRALFQKCDMIQVLTFLVDGCAGQERYVPSGWWQRPASGPAAVAVGGQIISKKTLGRGTSVHFLCALFLACALGLALSSPLSKRSRRANIKPISSISMPLRGEVAAYLVLVNPDE